MFLITFIEENFYILIIYRERVDYINGNFDDYDKIINKNIKLLSKYI